jgi:hypothetical protein
MFPPAKELTMQPLGYLRLLIAAGIAFGAPCFGLAQTSSAPPVASTTAPPAAPMTAPTWGPPVKGEMVPSLFVMNARGASLQGNTLTLEGISPRSIVFADRPVRAAGYALTKHLLEEWAAEGSFAKDPPNATVSVLSKEADAVTTSSSS